MPNPYIDGEVHKFLNRKYARYLSKVRQQAQIQNRDFIGQKYTASQNPSIFSQNPGLDPTQPATVAPNGQVFQGLISGNPQPLDSAVSIGTSKAIQIEEAYRTRNDEDQNIVRNWLLFGDNLSPTANMFDLTNGVFIRDLSTIDPSDDADNLLPKIGIFDITSNEMYYLDPLEEILRITPGMLPSQFVQINSFTASSETTWSGPDVPDNTSEHSSSSSTQTALFSFACYITARLHKGAKRLTVFKIESDFYQNSHTEPLSFSSTETFKNEYYDTFCTPQERAALFKNESSNSAGNVFFPTGGIKITWDTFSGISLNKSKTSRNLIRYNKKSSGEFKVSADQLGLSSFAEKQSSSQSYPQLVEHPLTHAMQWLSCSFPSNPDGASSSFTLQELKYSNADVDPSLLPTCTFTKIPNSVISSSMLYLYPVLDLETDNISIGIASETSASETFETTFQYKYSHTKYVSTANCDPDSPQLITQTPNTYTIVDNERTENNIETLFVSDRKLFFAQDVNANESAQIESIDMGAAISPITPFGLLFRPNDDYFSLLDPHQSTFPRSAFVQTNGEWWGYLYEQNSDESNNDTVTTLLINKTGIQATSIREFSATNSGDPHAGFADVKFISNSSRLFFDVDVPFWSTNQYGFVPTVPLCRYFKDKIVMPANILGSFNVNNNLNDLAMRIYILVPEGEDLKISKTKSVKVKSPANYLPGNAFFIDFSVGGM